MVSDQLTAPDQEARQTIAIRLTGAEGTPEHRLVSIRLPDGYALRASEFDLHIDADEDGVVVTDTFSTMYGAGDSIDVAIGDYLVSLFDTFADLESQEAILAPGLQGELAALRRHVSRVA